MIALEAVRTVFIWLCIHPDPDATTPKWKKYLRIFSAFVILLVLICFSISCYHYFVVHFESDLESAMFALYPIIFGCCLTYDVIVAHILRDDIIMTIAEFQNIYDECKFF